VMRKVRLEGGHYIPHAPCGYSMRHAAE
jgi:hypothetical protein